MAHNTTETDFYLGTVQVPDEGDDATALSVETAVQPVANRAKFLLAHLEYLTSLDNSTGSRVIANGAKRFRQVTTLANLSLLSVGAGNDNEIALVVDTGAPTGFYVYQHGSAVALSSPFVVNALSSTGRWFWMANQLLGGVPGLPFVDGAGLLQNVGSIDQNLVDNRITQIVSVSSSPVDEGASTILATSTTDAYVEGLAQNVTSLVSGDKLDIDITCHAENVRSSGAANTRAVVGLFVDDVLKATAFVDRDASSSASGLIQQVNLKHIFTATTTSHEIEVKVRGDTTDNIEGKLYASLYGKIMVIRP